MRSLRAILNLRTLSMYAIAVLFAAACVLPSALNGGSKVGFLLAMLSISAAVFLLLISIAKLLRDKGRFLSDRPFDRRLFFVAFGATFALWLVFFLVLYPGVFTVDSNDIVCMVSGLPFESDHFRYQSLNAHHPGAYVLFCWSVLSLGNLLGLGVTKSCALLSLAHLLVLSLCCSYVLERLYGLTKSKLVVGLFAVLILCNPLVGYYSATVWKDVIFGGVFAVFAIEYVAFLAFGYRSENKIRYAIFVIACCACALLRSNGLVVVVASLVIVLLVVSSNARRAAMGVLAAVLICYLLVAKVLYPLAGVVSAHASEGMAVPLQQIAYTIKEDGRLSEDQKERMSRILPLDKWKDGYVANLVNGIKFDKDFDDDYFEEHQLEFFADWLMMGCENPGKYFRAWCGQTESFWSVGAGTWYTEKPGYSLDGSGNIADNKLSGCLSVNSLKMWIEDFKEAFPWLFSMAWIAWIVIFSAAILFFLRRKLTVVCLFPIVGYWATFLIAAPANDFRYMFPALLCVPLVFGLLQYSLPQDERRVSSAHGNEGC